MPLPKALEEQMHSLLRRCLADLRSEKEVGEFLEDLLSPTEKVMLAKRLAIALLIEKGYDHRTIHRIMKVSLTTVSTVHYWLKNKGSGYRRVIEKILRGEAMADTLEKINKILENFLSTPPRGLPKIPFEQKSRDLLLRE